MSTSISAVNADLVDSLCILELVEERNHLLLPVEQLALASIVSEMSDNGPLDVIPRQ